MRQEATLTEWKELYEVATRIKALEPWKDFWDLDLISLQFEGEKEPIFVSILGRGGGRYGLSVYEGMNGLNDFLMLCMREQMNLSIEYTMFSQNNLTCYWGDKKELTDEQRKVVKELGYHYHGRNAWLYFMSYKEGYFPFQYDQDEVVRMTKYLTGLEMALEKVRAEGIKADFAHGECLKGKIKNGEIVSLKAEPLPAQSVQFGVLQLEDKELKNKLKKLKKTATILEADVQYLGAAVKDEEAGRPRHPQLCLLSEAESGMMLAADMTEAGEDGLVSLAEHVIGYMEEHGAPVEIWVSNVIVESVLEEICALTDTKLVRVKRLAGIEDFRDSMKKSR